VERRYRPGTLVLETTFHTADGVVRITDCMPVRGDALDLVRRVEGVSGRVPMRMHLTVRFDYGSIVPWVFRAPEGLAMVAGPDGLLLRTPIELRGEDYSTVGEFTVEEGDHIPFELVWYPSHVEPPESAPVDESIEVTTRWWTDWSGRAEATGPWADAVRDSLVVLKGLTYAPTGGIVAAATTSLPEAIGGPRNWDYRFCWLRDATFTLLALMEGGYTDEAKAWRAWLLRALAGQPDQAQIMYGPGGEHRLTELELDWLPGYEGSRPVRIGNGAHEQFQLDVFGEVLDALHQARVTGIDDMDGAWNLETKLVEVVEDHWNEPDDGIWEVRGGRQHFTHSKVMAWVALDRAIRSADRFGLDAPTERWSALRDRIHAEVLERGVDDRGVFVQAYGSKALDASALIVPLVGFLPPDDPRVVATVETIDRELNDDGFIRRYHPDHAADDGLAGGEGTFLMCTFWMADCLALLGRTDEATDRFERLLALRNDVGLLAEQYDPSAKRLLGNFPQAFSHVSLVSTAAALGGSNGLRTRRS
ncbi:MAG: glycoside hydrolase family 15 protein, partial [Acidimicrobiia bacterium]|nr:glycoside hydrolase family 15 protein [Acidimicrobiia bacterium]